MHSCIIRLDFRPKFEGKIEVHMYNMHPYFYAVSEQSIWPTVSHQPPGG